MPRAHGSREPSQPVRICPGCKVDFGMSADHKRNCPYGERPKPYNFIAYPETGYAEFEPPKGDRDIGPEPSPTSPSPDKPRPPEPAHAERGWKPD